MMKEALAAAEELAKEGVEAEVIDLRTIRPMDHGAILKSVRKTNRCVVVDENWPVASIASEVAYRVQKDAFDFLDAPVLRASTRRTRRCIQPAVDRGQHPQPGPDHRRREGGDVPAEVMVPHRGSGPDGALSRPMLPTPVRAHNGQRPTPTFNVRPTQLPHSPIFAAFAGRGDAAIG